jgi:hypothetical protein
VDKWPFSIKGVLNSIEKTENFDDQYLKRRAYFPYRKIFVQSNPHMNTMPLVRSLAANNYLRNALPQVTATWSTWGRTNIKVFDVAKVKLSNEPYTIRPHPDINMSEGEDIYMVTSLQHSMDGATKDYTLSITGERGFFDSAFYPRMSIFGYSDII